MPLVPWPTALAHCVGAASRFLAPPSRTRWRARSRAWDLFGTRSLTLGPRAGQLLPAARVEAQPLPHHPSSPGRVHDHPDHRHGSSIHSGKNGGRGDPADERYGQGSSSRVVTWSVFSPPLTSRSLSTNVETDLRCQISGEISPPRLGRVSSRH